MARCEGSGQRTYAGRFPGDRDRCRTCGASVRVRQDYTAGAHSRQHGENAERMRALTTRGGSS